MIYKITIRINEDNWTNMNKTVAKPSVYDENPMSKNRHVGLGTLVFPSKV